MARIGTAATRRSTMMAAGLVPILLLALLRIFDAPVMDGVAGLIFDSYQRSAPRPFRDAGVRVVDIDDESIRRLGQWPWPRGDIAALTARLREAGAAAIAFDIVFSEEDRTSPGRLAARAAADGASAGQVASLRSLPDQDQRLAGILAQSPSVLGFFLTRDKNGPRVEPKAGFAVAGSDPGASITAYEGAIRPLPTLSAGAAGLGFVSIRGDADGIIRRLPLLARQHGALVPGLSLEALRVAQGAGGFTVKSSDSSGEVNAGAPEAVAVKVGELEIPITERGDLWMHYTRPVPGRVVPAWRILEGRIGAAEMERLFSGQIVFVGAGAIGLRDLVSTPVADRELGVMVHAEAAEQMILGEFLFRPDWAKGLEVALVLAAGLLLVLLLPLMGALPGAFLAALTVAALGGGSWYAFRAHGFLIDPAPPVAAALLAYSTVSIFTYLREERQRAYIHRAFDRYLSPEMVRRITADPGQLELGGEEREMTVLFCDVRGFSAISERMGPKQIIGFLIAFLTPMTDVLLARRATIDKYIGDAILAFWNAPLEDPDQHRNAARSALEMQELLGRLNRENKDDPLWPGEVRIGIGMEAGPCCVGNMGSAQRLSYSLIGDTVNLASRIEGLTKQYGVAIAVGETLAAALSGFALVELDRVRVVGRDRPVTIFALVGDETVAERADFQAFLAGHRAMLGHYREQSWEEALACLERERAAAAGFGLDRVYERYAGVIRSWAGAPPPWDWDGIATAKSK